MPAASEPKSELDLRRVRFATYVGRLIDLALARGMSVKDIEKATGVSSTTFYGWRNGEWRRDPTPARVRAFVEGLGGSMDEANRALGWVQQPSRKRPAPEPMLEDPDVRAVYRKLSDPKVSAAEKAVFRRMMRAWAGTLDEEDSQ